MADYRPWSVIGCLLCSAPGALAQIPVLPEAPGTRVSVAGTLATLVTLHDTGRWQALQDTTRRIVSDVAADTLANPRLSKDALRGTARWLVVFAAPDASDQEKYRLVRYLAGPGVAEPFSTTLDGVTELFEIALTEGPVSGELASSYVVSKKRDPLADQLPSAVRTALDPAALAKILPTAMLNSNFAPEMSDTTGPRRVHALVRRVLLPEKRADVAVRHRLTLVAMPGLGADAVKVVNALCSRWSADSCETPLNAELHACGIGLAKHLNDIVQQAREPSLGDMRKFGSAVSALLKSETSSFLSANCANQTLEAYAFAEVVEKMFIGTVTPKTVVAEGDMSLANVPRERLSFGVGSAFVLGDVRGSRQVEVNDSGVYSVDPLGPTLTMVTLNLLPWPGRSDEERHGTPLAFIGTTLTPAFGAAFGVGLDLWRHLSIIGGRAFVVVDRLPAGEGLGDTARSNDPLDTGVSSCWFGGLGYAFK